MRWEDHIPEDWISKDGRLWRDMSWVERQIESGSNPSLRRLWPKSFRDKRAMALRSARSGDYLVAGLGQPASRPSTGRRSA